MKTISSIRFILLHTIFALVASLSATATLTAYSWANFVGQPGGEGNVNGGQVVAMFAYPLLL